MDFQIQIYVPCCNYGRYLTEALNSIVNQTFKNWHCYIIDENSNDNTFEIATQFIKKFGTDKFTYIKNDKRLGLQKIANWVFKNSDAPYVIRLDADDYWLPHLLEKLLRVMIKNPKAALAFGGFNYISHDGNYLDAEASVNYLGRYESGLEAPHGACTLIDRKKFLAEGLYFEDVDAQDGWDLWLKCYPKYEFIAIDEPLFCYRQHHNSLSRNTDRIFRARRKLVELNLNTYPDNGVQVIIPAGTDLNFETKNVRKHLHRLLSAINESKHLLKPIITIDNESQFEITKKLDLDIEIKFTGESFIHGMSPFKLLDMFPLISDGKMWLNFKSNSINSQILDNAVNTFWKFNLGTCISVVEQREPVFKLTAKGLKSLSDGRYADYKLKTDELWRMNNVLVISKKISVIIFSMETLDTLK